VQDYNFATPSGLGIDQDNPSNNFPDWGFQYSSGYESVIAVDSNRFSGTLDSSPNVLAMNNGANIFQNLGTMHVGQTYNFNISYGWRNDVFNAGLQATSFQFTLRPSITSSNAFVVSQSPGWSYGAAPLPNGVSIQTAPEPTGPGVLQYDQFSYTASAADNGQPLTLQMYVQSPGTSQLLINQIILNTVTAPVDPTQLFYTGAVNGTAAGSANFDSTAVDNFALSNGSSAQFTNDSTKTTIFGDSRIDNGANVSNTSVVIQNNGVFPLAVDVTANSLVYTFTDNDGSNGISGPASLVKSGSSTLNLAGPNNYSGGTTISAGTVNVNNNSALGTGPVSFPGAATLQAGALSVTLNNAITLGSGETTLDTNGNTLTLAGAITNTAVFGVIAVPIMNVIGSGTLNLTGSFNVSSNSVAGDYPALYLASNGTTVNVTGTGYISNVGMSWKGSVNTLFLNPAGTLTVGNAGDGSVDLGQQGGQGAVFQSVGTVNMLGNFNLARWDSSYGSYLMNGSGATLNVVNMDVGAFGAPGTTFGGNCMALLSQTAGTINVSGNTVLVSEGAGSAVEYLTGGTYNNAGGTIIIGGGNGSTTSASLTVAGTSNASAKTIVLNDNDNTPGTAVLNLNTGGNLSSGSVTGGSTVGNSIVNFNGGALTVSASGVMSGLTAANIYSGGAIINTGSNSFLIAQNLSTVNGSSGVSSNPGITTAGSNYIGAPVVSITGGGGNGATGVATVVGGAVTGVTITNPGTGYTSAPTISLLGGGGSGALVASPALAKNGNDGGLIKLGTGTLTLSGSNTYNGNTQVQAGTLIVANKNALGTGTAVLSNHATLALGSVPSGLYQFNSDPAGNDYVLGNSAFMPFFSNNNYTVQMTNNTGSNATEVYLQTPVTISDATGFTASFTYNHTTVGGLNSAADGITLVLQDIGDAAPGAAGAAGDSLGYAGTGLTGSVAAGIDLYNDALETGVGNGTSAAFQVPAGVTTTLYGPNGAVINTNNPSGSNTVPLISQSPSLLVTVTYAFNASTGGQLTEKLTNPVSGISYTYVTTGLDLQSYFSGTNNEAYIGFTAATGGANDVQTISNFSFANTSAGVPYTPVSITNPLSVATGSTGVLQLAATANYSTGSVGPITIGSGGVLSVSIGSNALAGVTRGLLVTPSVTFSNASSGQLDIGVNGLDITTQNQSNPSSSLHDVTAMVATAYANGTWTGPGITSSVAAAATSHLTAVGVVQNSQLPSPYNSSHTFMGTAPGASDILVKYTYYGDANLDGTVNSADYSMIDNGFLTHATGWANGDFNYDGVINGSDYTLIDNAFNMQGASLAAEVSNQIASPTAQIAGGVASAVPEPASLSLLTMGGMALLGRRRRR
jgi:autotransporter-associated beta strand protein